MTEFPAAHPGGRSSLRPSGHRGSRTVCATLLVARLVAPERLAARPINLEGGRIVQQTVFQAWDEQSLG